jgi:hypothetical protein
MSPRLRDHLKPSTSQYHKSGAAKRFGRDDFKKTKEKGGMFSSNIDRSTYDGTLPYRKRQQTDKVDMSFYSYSTYN